MSGSQHSLAHDTAGRSEARSSPSGGNGTFPNVSPSGSGNATTPSHSFTARPLEIAESIRALHELHQMGGLTEEEFTQAKQQILESSSSSSSSSAKSTQSSKCPSCEKRKRRRYRKASAAADVSHATRSTRGSRRRAARRGRSRSRSTDSSSTSSSSGSDGSRFIVVPRANVWRTLQADEDAHLSEYGNADEHADTPVVHSPLFAAGDDAGVSFEDDGVGKERRRARLPSRGQGLDPSSLGAMEEDHDGEGVALLVNDRLPSRAATASDPMPPLAPNDERRASLVADSSSQNFRHSPSSADGPRAGHRERVRYGTFFQSSNNSGGGSGLGVGVDAAARAAGAFVGDGGKAPLEPEHEVHVRYYNSRGGSGDRFSEVRLRDDEMRDPIFLHKGVAAVAPGGGRGMVSATHTRVPGNHSGPGSVEMPTMVSMTAAGSQVFHLEALTVEEQRAWAGAEADTSLSRSSRHSSSYIEQSLNWYWIDVTGRDPTRRRYNSALRFLTRRFSICESFLVDREHVPMLPQIAESPNHPGQYLVNLRVATRKISISDDSVIELTNRWIIIVDLRQHFVMTLHRVDTHSMAQLRSQWRKIMGSNEVSFQEFLLKIIDDALQTYVVSLDVHTDLLDRCESKIFANENKLHGTTDPHAGRKGAEHLVDTRILRHFAGSSRSPFLKQLLDVKNHKPLNKTEMNSFLHHLHRRTNVQHRMLNATQLVLQKAFTKLQLCSKEMADQMCGTCIELSGRALEVRDDAKTLLDLHISLQSFRTNELMAVLTRVSLFFTPCTFLAGVYGMNFRVMPELDWSYGYPIFWVCCFIFVVVMQKFMR